MLWVKKSLQIYVRYWPILFCWIKDWPFAYFPPAMPAPSNVPVGVPPGLEYLVAVDQLLIKQVVEILEGKINHKINAYWLIKLVRRDIVVFFWVFGCFFHKNARSILCVLVFLFKFSSKTKILFFKKCKILSKNSICFFFFCCYFSKDLLFIFFLLFLPSSHSNVPFLCFYNCYPFHGYF